MIGREHPGQESDVANQILLCGNMHTQPTTHKDVLQQFFYIEQTVISVFFPQYVKNEMTQIIVFLFGVYFSSSSSAVINMEIFLHPVDSPSDGES